jgi:hypothetical protein
LCDWVVRGRIGLSAEDNVCFWLFSESNSDCTREVPASNLGPKPLTEFLAASVSPSASMLQFFFHWHYSPLWDLACRTMFFHFSLSATNSLHLLTPSTWRSLSTSSFHPFLGLPLLLVPSSSWVKIFFYILSSSILCKWPNQLNFRHFIHFTIFSPLLISSSSRFVPLFHSPFSYLGPYILLNI